jgi:hypothetical protein
MMTSSSLKPHSKRRSKMKLKTVRYFGSFYEWDGGLGWMPFWRVWIIKYVYNVPIHWVPQSEVHFG